LEVNKISKMLGLGGPIDMGGRSET